MSDLNTVLPRLSTAPFSHVIPSLERNHITSADLLTLDPADVAKRAQLPVREVTRIRDAVLRNLAFEFEPGNEADDQHEASVAAGNNTTGAGNASATAASSSIDTRSNLTSTGPELVDRWQAISILDEGVDAALGGGIPTGYLTEVTGESGAGKTQFLYTLLLAVQLAPPHGLRRNAIYISTEAALQTRRLDQMLTAHSLLKDLLAEQQPSLANILAIRCPDTESQDHILYYQLPVAIERQNVGLVVIDSITANYRAEFEARRSDGSASSMAERSERLQKLGAHLRRLAREYRVAVVVANQVGDRFSLEPPFAASATLDSGQPAAKRLAVDPVDGADALPSSSGTSTPVPIAMEPPSSQALPFGFNESHSAGHEPFLLDYQLNFFSGWVVPPLPASMGSDNNPKTPSLGLVWATQIACRIALVKGRRASTRSGVRRFFKVVFAPWAAPTEEPGLEFEITAAGLKSILS